jgi:hypothetical protein
MVDYSIRDGVLTLEILGLHKLWALKRRLELPLAQIREVRRSDPNRDRVTFPWIRMPGTYFPGLIAAGTFYRGKVRGFWDVSNFRRAITLELEGGRYDRVVVEVADPERAVEAIRKATGASRA